MGESGHQESQIPARPHWPVATVSYGTSVEPSSVDEGITIAPVEEPVSESVEERSLVKKSLDGNIGTITLDNPPKHNALGAALIGELLLALSDLTNAGARSDCITSVQGSEGLVRWARCPGIADQWPRSIDVRRSVAKSGARD
jgi:hypothetical protein